MEIREQVLSAAVRVVNEQGWRGATTRRIAEAAGVNEVTLFRHFGCKETLIQEAMRWSAERVPLQTLPEEPGDVEMELGQWASKHYRHLIEVRAHIRKTIGEFELHPEVASWAKRVPKHQSMSLERYLTRLRERGQTGGSWDPRAAANMLLGTLFADAISRDIIPERLPSPAEDAPRQYVALFLTAIGFRPTAS